MCSGACRQDVLCPADVVVKAISEAQIGQNESKVAMELNEVCDLIIDCEHKTAPIQETGFPSIRTPNIGRGRFILDGVNRVSEETYSLWTKRAVPQPGDLIMAREAPVGNVAMIPEGLRPCLGQRTLLIRPNRTKVEPSFLNYFLNGPHVQGLIHAKTNGATVAHLNMKDVRTMTLPELPPLPVQRRIAGILSAYDELMENSQRRIRLLETMARALYREWFVHFRFRGHEKQPCVASLLGDIPHGWEVRKVAEFAEFARGIEPGSQAYTKEPAPNHIKFLRVGDLSKRDSELYIPLELAEGRILEPLDIAITLDGSVGLVRLGLSGAYSTGVRKVLIGDVSRLGWSFAYHLLMSDSIQATIQAHAKGTTIKHAGTAVAALEFVSPPKDLIERFEHATAPMLKQILALQDQIQNLRRTRDLLLPRLLSGQIEIGNN